MFVFKIDAKKKLAFKNSDMQVDEAVRLKSDIMVLIVNSQLLLAVVYFSLAEIWNLFGTNIPSIMQSERSQLQLFFAFSSLSYAVSQKIVNIPIGLITNLIPPRSVCLL